MSKSAYTPSIKDVTAYQTSIFNNQKPRAGNVYLVMGFRPGKETIDGKIYEIKKAQFTPSVIERGKDVFLKEMIKKHKL